MLEDFDLADLAVIADSLPGPHSWTHGTADIFYCQACHITFEFGVDPVRREPCDYVDVAAITGSAGGILRNGIPVPENELPLIPGEEDLF